MMCYGLSPTSPLLLFTLGWAGMPKQALNASAPHDNISGRSWPGWIELGFCLDADCSLAFSHPCSSQLALHWPAILGLFSPLSSTSAAPSYSCSAWPPVALFQLLSFACLPLATQIRPHLPCPSICLYLFCCSSSSWAGREKKQRNTKLKPLLLVCSWAKMLIKYSCPAPQNLLSGVLGDTNSASW